MSKRNVIVAQSGGPSPVINASLAGVVESVLDCPDHFDAIYGAWHGIEGVLQEELMDLRAQSREEIGLLKCTPASGAIGTCRYKLDADYEEDFQRIIDVFHAHNIGVFFYIGGNDSMDTADKVAALAHREGYDLRVIGVPKTIDNDVGDPEFRLIDHTPGYGSTARYWSHIIQNANEENRAISPSECVSVWQAMGRCAGWITAAARLADPNREMPLQLYLPEAGHNLDSLADHVNDQLKQTGRCIVVASEGFNAGDLGEARDGFGHVEYGASRTTVAQKITNHLNEKGLCARGQATGQVPGVSQRCTSLFASNVDIQEAYDVARHAVELAVQGRSGCMATLLRKPGETYEITYDDVPLDQIANSVRHVPENWLAPNRIDVTDDFIRYAQPLIGESTPAIRIENGLQRFARLKHAFVDKTAPAYVPIRFRT